MSPKPSRLESVLTIDLQVFWQTFNAWAIGTAFPTIRFQYKPSLRKENPLSSKTHRCSMTASQQQPLGRGFIQSQDKALNTCLQSIKGTQAPLTNKLHRRICLSKRFSHASHIFEFVRYLKYYYYLFTSARAPFKIICPCRYALLKQLTSEHHLVSRYYALDSPSCAYTQA
jgi:hypothetical protein